VEHRAAVFGRKQISLLRNLSSLDSKNLLIPDCNIVLVPSEADLKIMVLGNELQDCLVLVLDQTFQ
jgi:hypothetical protein